MKRILFAIMITLVAATAAHAADVGVSVSVGQPGFYGRIDIGGFPQPEVIYARPVVVRPAPVVFTQPVYMRVPPGHAKNWSRYCDRYNACGHPVYFVRDRWYKEVYVPQNHARVERHGNDNHGGNHGLDRGHN
jgi:opacity protein-like surface antigen